MDLSPRRIFFILVPLALSLLIIAQAMKWQVDTIWKPCPVEPPPVDLLEIRKKVDEIIWPHIEESVSHVMFVSAPRCIRPESDSELPGYRLTKIM